MLTFAVVFMLMLSALTMAKPVGANGAVDVMFETNAFTGAGAVDGVVTNIKVSALARFNFSGAVDDIFCIMLMLDGGIVVGIVVVTVVVTVVVGVGVVTPVGGYTIFNAVVVLCAV